MSARRPHEEIPCATVDAAFSRACQRAPEAPALLVGDAVWSYDRLAQTTSHIAHALAAAGVTPGDKVALHALRGAETVAGMFACFRLGAVLVPLDPAFAPELCAAVQEQIAFAAVLTCCTCEAETQDRFSGIPVVRLDAPVPVDTALPQIAPGPEDPAMILYTSGSTGRPKGVVLPHRALLGMALNQPLLSMHPGDVALHATTYACDGALYDLLVPLLNGAAVAILPTPAPSLDEIASVMIRHRVTVPSLYAALNNLMVEHRVDAFASARMSVSGGDAMSVDHARKLLVAWPEIALINVYGPTETCAQSLCHRVTQADLDAGEIPIGKALPGEAAFLLDDTGAAPAPGAPGEIYIAGDGVALGYHAQGDVTQDCFVPDPRPGQSGRVYRTGDWAQLRADGVFLFRGRRDRQAKIAGRRVELDGVEHVLSALPGVARAAVLRVPGKSGHDSLAAVIEPSAAVKDDQSFAAELRRIATDLSPQLFPRRVITVKALPLTPSGKLDRAALNAIWQASCAASSGGAPGAEPAARPPSAPSPVPEQQGGLDPADTPRHALSRIWQDILGGPPPQDHETFFDRGGTSLQLMDALARMRARFGLELTSDVLFAYPRFGHLVAYLSDMAGADPNHPGQPAHSGDAGLTGAGASGLPAQVAPALAVRPCENKSHKRSRQPSGPVQATLPKPPAAPKASGSAPKSGQMPEDRSNTRPGDTRAEHLPTAPAHRQTAGSARDIAIVGMAARLPGGLDLDGLWRLVRTGRSLHMRLDQDDALSGAEQLHPSYVAARPILHDVEMLDPDFFGMTPAEAARMDPQVRVFLELCQEACDHAAIDPARAGGDIGVFAGAPMSTYLLDNLLHDRTAAERFTASFQHDYTALAGNTGDGIAARVAHALNLTGPAIGIQAACATSLVAVAQAVAALRAGTCDLAFAGGVSITFPQRRGYLYSEGGMASPDGTCRPFDARAAGTVFGHGAGCVLLRPVAEALAAGDRILAVIRGVGLSNDGAQKMSYAAPSAAGQERALRKAQADAGTRPEEIGYVECHGTGTPLGDPIELAALSAALGSDGAPCALGAVKANLGHLDAAAGVVGLIKTVQVLQHRCIPPLAQFTNLHPNISLSGRRLQIPTEAREWSGSGPRLAGVSAFGVGGSNAHVILQEAPEAPPRALAGDRPRRAAKGETGTPWYDAPCDTPSDEPSDEGHDKPRRGAYGGPWHRVCDEPRGGAYGGPIQGPSHGAVLGPIHSPAHGPIQVPTRGPYHGPAHGPVQGPAHRPVQGPVQGPVHGPWEGPMILPLSAHSPAALHQMARDLADSLEAPQGPELPALARSLQDGRREGPWRMALTAKTKADAVAQLRALPHPDLSVSGLPVSGNPVSGNPVPDPPVSDLRVSERRASDQPAPEIPVRDTPVPDHSAPDPRAAGLPVSGLSMSGFSVSGVPVSGVPVSGVPVSGVPVSGVPVSGVPVSGVPVPENPVPDRPETERSETERPETDPRSPVRVPAGAARWTGAPDNRHSDGPVFLFPGQGTLSPGTGKALYETAPVFAHWIDTGAAQAAPTLGCNLRDVLFGTCPDAQDKLENTRIAQPALFVLEVALARLWMDLGLHPKALIGHSLGEWAAATLAGIMPFDTALSLVVTRGALMAEAPRGAMFAVGATAQRLQPLLPPGCEIAARNAPSRQTVSGPDAPMAQLATRLSDAGISYTRLAVRHSFHSAAMAPAARALERAMADIRLHPPRLPVLSTVTGQQLTDRDACDPAYWARHLRAPVLFQDAVSTAFATGSAHTLEIGPGQSLSAFTRQILPRGSHHEAITSLPDHARSQSDVQRVAAAASRLWTLGHRIRWARLGARGAHKCALPPYPFQRQRCWIDAPPRQDPKDMAQQVAPDLASPVTQADAQNEALTPETGLCPAPRIEAPAQETTETSGAPQSPPRGKLATILTEVTGLDFATADPGQSFLEHGLDSLALAQVARAVSGAFGIDFGFVRLFDDVTSFEALAAYLQDAGVLEAIPPRTPQVATPPPQCNPTQSDAPGSVGSALQGVLADAADRANALLPDGAADRDTAQVIAAQLSTLQEVFAAQLQALGSPGRDRPPRPGDSVNRAAPSITTGAAHARGPGPAAQAQAQSHTRAPSKQVRRAVCADLSPAQRRFASDLATRYANRFAKSKSYAQTHRGHMADPRTAAGFHPDWKELTFPIVTAEAHGAILTDIDGNRLIDLVNGFGQNAFGHAPDFVTRALEHQLARGMPIGPQSDLAGPVADRLARMLGHARVSFCNTGSEAVMAAIRAARTVTGRDHIVVFEGAYHGQFDEVLVKAAHGPAGARPRAPGIPVSACSHVTVLPYGRPEALDWLRSHAGKCAAVLVEPVQSRRPGLRPRAFVQAVRDITRESGAAMVMDEVVTGFRTHPAGMQGVWGIRGDLATYGKIIGGGLPMGVLAGSARFMDALDGGAWRFGDDSRPEAMPTFVAGTFVRHPLALAAVAATLDHLETAGAHLWRDTADRTKQLVFGLRAALARRGLPDVISHYSSWFTIDTGALGPHANVLFPLMRLHGVHVLDGFAAFLTTAHDDSACARIQQAFDSALETLVQAGLVTEQLDAAEAPTARPQQPTGYALTEGQKEIWLSHQKGGAAAAAFNESTALILRGPLDVAALDRAWTDLLARHDGLRLRFAPDGSGVQLRTDPAPAICRRDLRAAPDPTASRRDLEARNAAQPFDLTQDWPVRAHLLRFEEHLHDLILTAHHAVADGVALGLLIEELGQLYSAHHGSAAPALPAAPSFCAYAQRAVAHDTHPGSLAFWRGHLDGVSDDVSDRADLPTDRPRPAQRSHSGATLSRTLPRTVLDAMRAGAAQHGGTLFTLGFAALHQLVQDQSGISDVILAVPVSHRPDAEAERLVAHRTHLLPIRVQTPVAATEERPLAPLQRALSQAMSHADLTYGTLLRALDLPRRADRMPLTGIAYTLEHSAAPPPMPGLETDTRPVPKAAVTFDLYVNLSVRHDGLRMDLHYNTDLFDTDTVAHWAEDLESRLRRLAGLPDAALAGPARAPVLTGARPAPFKPLAELIGEAAQRHPAQTAVTCGDETVTYKALQDRSDALAGAIARHLPEPGARIAVALPRGVDLPCALLAVHKAGHAFVPLDPDLPGPRLRSLCREASASALITADGRVPDYAKGLGLTALSPLAARPGERAPGRTIAPQDPAYVIFTSGSTGTPKGVEVPQRALSNLLTSLAKSPGLSARDTLLAVTTIGFDIALAELFLPLCTGGRVVIAAREEARDAFALAHRLQRGDITVLQATPTLWDGLRLAGFTPPASLAVWCGGEPLPQDLANSLTAQGAALWNLYGPTETTIWSACQRIAPGAAVTLGGPLDGTELHVLAPDGTPARVGQTGTLCITGLGLAHGYVNAPEQNAQAFRELRMGGELCRSYDTGDLARISADGAITLLGRQDDQVKLRGFRIALGEITHHLRQFPSVAQAAVALRQRGSDAVLVGYLVPAQQDAPVGADIGRALAQTLPDYMVPQAWVVLKALPVTSNGKLDRAALPDPFASTTVPDAPPMDPPATPSEHKIAALWASVLDSGDLSVTATLFDLGLDSLTVFRIAARMMSEGWALEAKHMFAHPTIRALAQFHDTRDAQDAGPMRPRLKDYRHGAKRPSQSAAS